MLTLMMTQQEQTLLSEKVLGRQLRAWLAQEEHHAIMPSVKAIKSHQTKQLKGLGQ